MWGKAEKRKPLFGKPYRVRKTFYVLLILLAVYGIVRHGILPVVWRVQANSLARQYEENPSDVLAMKLAAMLDRRAFSRKRGREVLAMLLRPDIAKRDAYPVNVRPLFKVYRRPCPLRNFGMTEQCWCVDWTGARQDENPATWGPTPPFPMIGSMPTIKRGANYFSRSILTPKPKEPGEYTHTKGFQYSLYAVKRKLKFGLPPWPRVGYWKYIPFWIEALPVDTTQRPVYETEFEIKIDFNIVPEGQDPGLAFLSNPELDAAMKASISSATTNSTWFVSSRMKPAIRGRGGYWITFTNPTENAAFMMYFRDEAGREHPLGDSVFDAVYVQAGETKQYGVPMGIIVSKLDTPSHQGTLIFRTDRDAAYADPDIKTVWDGELEVPIEWE